MAITKYESYYTKICEKLNAFKDEKNVRLLVPPPVAIIGTCCGKDTILRRRKEE